MRLILPFLIALTTPVAGLACAPADTAAVISDLGRVTNALRGRGGRGALPLDAHLNAVAQAHACDIAARATITHQDAAGRLPMQRLRRAGYRACFSAENVAMGTPDAAGTVHAWQGSPGHARNQQTPRAGAMGFGVARGADGRLWWVGLYAAGCPRVAGTLRAGW